MSFDLWHGPTTMRIVISEFISLDGVVQAPGGPDEDTEGGFRHGGWSMPFFDPEVMGGFIGGAMEHTDAILQGARTWKVMAGAWPERTGDDDPFTDWMNNVPKYVVSDSLSEADVAKWAPTTIIRRNELAQKVNELRAQPGGDVNIMGSATVARALLAADPVDELDLMIEPVVLGGGKSIFTTDGIARRFRLESVTPANTGVLCCRYVPAE
jgi:dihydrofolate reductase